MAQVNAYNSIFQKKKGSYQIVIHKSSCDKKYYRRKVKGCVIEFCHIIFDRYKVKEHYSLTKGYRYFDFTPKGATKCIPNRLLDLELLVQDGLLWMPIHLSNLGILLNNLGTLPNSKGTHLSNLDIHLSNLGTIHQQQPGYPPPTATWVPSPTATWVPSPTARVPCSTTATWIPSPTTGDNKGTLLNHINLDTVPNNRGNKGTLQVNLKEPWLPEEI